jgi:hypothetical protein
MRTTGFIHLIQVHYDGTIDNDPYKGLGRKAARLFTKEERGSFKFKYCRHKIVWDLISLHVNAGITAHRSCDMIYAHYGEQLPVTKIINSLCRDISRSGIPIPLHVGL